MNEFEIAVTRKDFQNLLENMKDDSKQQNAKNFVGSWARTFEKPISEYEN